MAKTYQQFVENATGNPYDTLVQICKGLGYDKIKKKSGFRFNVLVDGNRLEVMKKLEAAIQQVYPDAKWDENAGDSSIGAIVMDRYMVGASPASKQGKASAGLANEHTLFNMISEITKGGPTDIIFKAGSKKIEVKGVTGYKDAGRDTVGGKKADIVIFSEDGDVPISLKKDKAEMWESADSYYAKKAKATIDKLIEKEEVELVPYKNVYQIKPNLAIKASRQEIQKVVFGSDLLGKGFVLEKTFTGKYTYEGDKAVIEVTKIIDKIGDLKGDYEIYFLIRNDSSRKGSKIYPGIRVLAVKKTRINRNVKVVK
jgi:hypothetical protein